MPESKKRVVVVGGGVGGAHAAKFLEDYSDVTLIDPKDHFEIPYAGLRSVVEPEFAKRSVILHSDYLKKAKRIASTAETASDTALTTSSGESIPYDFLVIATGSTYNGHESRAGRLQHYQSENKKVKDANTILIIGGGPVGVELAGEIVVDFPEKKVIVVHSGSRLIEFLGPKASKKALNWLQSKKVEVYLNDRVEVDSSSGSSKEYKTKSGKTIKADCHFVCIGRKVGSSWLQGSAVAEMMGSDGRLKVDENLRVEGKTKIFAVGDITSIKENKQGYLAVKHAEVVAENIKRLSKAGGGGGSKGVKLSTYKAAGAMGMVSLGRKVAVAQLPFGTISGRFPGMMKSKDLFVGSTRKGLGLSP